MLNKGILQNSIYSKVRTILLNRNEQGTSGKSDEDPLKVIDDFAQDLAAAVADSVDTYIKAGDINISGANISVVTSSLGSPAVVTPLTPARIV